MPALPPEEMRDEQAALAAPPEPPVPSTEDTRRRMAFIGMGIFLVVLAYPDSGIGKLPFRYLLKDQLHLGPGLLAAFFFWVNFPSWCKPIIGIFSDSVPLFGTRRRFYLLFGACIGVLLWGVMALTPHRYLPLLAVGVAINAMATVGGTINGAVVMEEGRRRGATGYIASVRSVFQHVGSVLVGVVGGGLATRALGWTCAAGALLMSALALLTFFCLHETPSAHRDADAWKNAKAQLLLLARSGPLWAAAGLMFMVQVAPGFSTPLFFYQTDALHFTPKFVGLLGSIGSACSVAAGFVYFWLCHKVRLRGLIALCITLNVFSALGYLAYHTHTQAVVIDALYGLTGALAFLSLFDLMARATPRGSEAMGYSILYAGINLAGNASDRLGSGIFEYFHRHFSAMVYINAGTTALVLLAIPLLPAALVNWKDGEKPKI